MAIRNSRSGFMNFNDAPARRCARALHASWVERERTRAARCVLLLRHAVLPQCRARVHERMCTRAESHGGLARRLCSRSKSDGRLVSWSRNRGESPSRSLRSRPPPPSGRLRPSSTGYGGRYCGAFRELTPPTEPQYLPPCGGGRPPKPEGRRRSGGGLSQDSYYRDGYSIERRRSSGFIK